MANFFELSPADMQDVQLVMWSEADWRGDPEDTKSTSGFLLELQNQHAGRRLPMSWAIRGHGSISSLTTEAETVPLAYAVKHEDIPA